MRVIYPDVWLDGAVQVLQATAEACELGMQFSYIWCYH